VQPRPHPVKRPEGPLPTNESKKDTKNTAKHIPNPQKNTRKRTKTPKPSPTPHPTQEQSTKNKNQKKKTKQIKQANRPKKPERKRESHEETAGPNPDTKNQTPHQPHEKTRCQNIRHTQTAKTHAPPNTTPEAQKQPRNRRANINQIHNPPQHTNSKKPNKQAITRTTQQQRDPTKSIRAFQNNQKTPNHKPH